VENSGIAKAAGARNKKSEIIFSLENIEWNRGQS
jgi:hypothetical protein